MCQEWTIRLNADYLKLKSQLAFARRALADTEGGYAEVERELQAMLFGAVQFHQFTYEHKMDMQLDHKPIQGVMKNPLLSAPKQLGCMLLRLQHYEVKLRYCPGKPLLVKETLRSHTFQNTPQMALWNRRQSLSACYAIFTSLMGGSKQSNKALNRRGCYRQ